ncbi:hypothetical protein ABPG75_000380 [Micractinium tetrahymenae]
MLPLFPRCCFSKPLRPAQSPPLPLNNQVTTLTAPHSLQASPKTSKLLPAPPPSLTFTENHGRPEMLCDRARSPPHVGAGALLRGGSTAAGGAGAVATFPLSVERKGRSTSLDVPFTFGAPLRHGRLTEWLGKERWAVRGGAAPATASPGGATEAAVQAAELLFVRDVLGPLRLRPGAVPEKIVARLLAIGVMALHKRCEALFGQRWADFLLARWPEASPAPSAATSAPPPAPTPALPTASTATTAAPTTTTAAITTAALAPSPPPTAPLSIPTAATAPPPLLSLPAVSEADDGGEEPLLALLFGAPSAAGCLVGGFEGAGDNGDELEVLLLPPGGGCGGGRLGLAAEAEMEWEEALTVPPTPAGGGGFASAYAVPAAAQPAAQPLAAQLGLAPLVAPAEAAPPSSQDAELAQLVAELAAPAAPALPAAGAALLLPDELPEIPPCFASADLAAELAAEAAAGAADSFSADLDLLCSCDTWDLFPPPPSGP